MTQEYLVVDITYSGTSPRTQGEFWTIKLLGLEDGVYYKTYPDTSMLNFEHWNTIVNDPGYFVLGNLKAKRTIKPIVNADREPSIVWQGTFKEMKRLERLVFDTLKPKAAPSTFSTLFD